MTKTSNNSEWPTFRGRRLTAKELRSGLVITPLFPDGPQPFDGTRIPRELVWADQRARIFLELRFGWPPFETIDNVSILTGAMFHKLREDAEKLYALPGDQDIDEMGNGVAKRGYLNRIVFQVGTERPVDLKSIKRKTT